MDFISKLEKGWSQGKFVCVGLDPVLEKIPQHLNGDFFEFNKAIIDETIDLVLAYKPNTAFYESLSEIGLKYLDDTIDYIHDKNPNIPIILDAKRGDIGNTNQGYVDFAFGTTASDAITLHPYLGKEAMKPFLDRADKGVIFLVKTSNPGSDEFQNLETDGKPLYLRVAENVAKDWNYNGNCAIVVGATYPEELSNVRKVVADMPILIPGIGAQGGDLKKTLKAGLTKDKKGIIISSSRSIIFASSSSDFAKAARLETEKLNNEIKSLIK